MQKYIFSNAERYAVWMYHGKSCYWCNEPLRLNETTVDHVLPEILLEKKSEYEKIKIEFNLPESFEINSYANWLPCHDRCNKEKSRKVFSPAPFILAILEKLIREKDEVKKHEERIKSNNTKDKILAKIMTAIDDQKIDIDDILAIFPDHELKADEARRFINDIRTRTDSERWKVIGVNNEIATLTDGRLVGISPIDNNPDISWMCPTCGSYGPWNGTRCMNCGQMSDPTD